MADENFKSLNIPAPEIPEDYDGRRWSYPKGKFDWCKPPALAWGGWEKWEDDMKGKYPIRFFFYETIPDIWGDIRHKVRNIKWWFFHRFHPKHRYHVVRTRLEPGYYDPDTLILESCFALLCDFVEYNTVKEHIDWDVTPETREIWDEMNRLANWFNFERPHREEAFDLMYKDVERPENVFNYDQDDPRYKPYHDYLKAITDYENKWRDEDEEMLIRLMKIRNYLWYA